MGRMGECCEFLLVTSALRSNVFLGAPRPLPQSG
jgi:hypothetical protein